ncbi:MAG TPA: hypothetical protein VFP32_02195, partial [Candidatus Saccharimonadales bacterium]|nr:hypothetical protein [Candidatus Saccharimonadales bacterium]
MKAPFSVHSSQFARRFPFSVFRKRIMVDGIHNVNSKRLTVNGFGQQGMASFVVVSVMVVLLTLISLGFARLMSRTSIDSANRQLGNQAGYAAQSGINDVIAYMKQYAKDHPAAPYVSSPQCDSLIGTAANKGPFYNDSDLSGDTSRNASYTCILLNQTPVNLVYSIPEQKSQVVKITTSAATPGSLGSIMLSWQPTKTSLTGYPPYPVSLLDDTTWNANGYMPILRMTLYMVPASGDMTNMQANSRTFFLYPRSPSGPNNVPVQDYTTIKDGQILPVVCGKTDTGNFKGTADYRCNLIISNLNNGVSSPTTDPLDYVYARMLPIYGQTDVNIQANSKYNQQLEFVNDQAVVDVTAKVSNVSKRLQARVGLNDTSSTTSGGNIPATSDGLPNYAVRSSDALCKQMTIHHSYFDYVSLDGPDKICGSSSVIDTKAPTLDYSIVGNDGADAGKTVHPPDNTPDSTQKGTVYINSSATLKWNTNYVTKCTTGGNDAGWNSYDVLGSSDWSGTQSSHSLDRNGLTNVTNYSLHCQGPGGDLPTYNLTAWPSPTVAITNKPASVNAGDSITLDWSVNNANNCTFSGPWNSLDPVSYPGGPPSTGSRGIKNDWNDNSTRTYTITCTDPSGRSASDSFTLSTSGGPPTAKLNPPNCTINTLEVIDNGDQTGLYHWDGSCPNVPSESTINLLETQSDYDSFSEPGYGGCWVALSGKEANVNANCIRDSSKLPDLSTSGTGTYCFGYRIGAGVWGYIDSKSVCGTIVMPPVVMTMFSVGQMVFYA